MDDERIIAIKENVSTEIRIAEDNFESAVLLYESEKYRPSIPLFRDSVLSGIKALLMLHLDDLPDDSNLIDSYYQTGVSKEIKLEIGLDEILKKLKSVEQDSIEHPLSISKESIRDLDTCYNQIENFLSKASKSIKISLLTTQEIKKRKYLRKLILTSSAVVVVILVLIRIILMLVTAENGLTGNYFTDRNFQTLIETHTYKEIDFDWGLGIIIQNYKDNVSIRWEGEIKTPISGEYTFITRSDDGARLWIDDKLVIDDWTIHAAENRRGKINLEKGYHRIKVEYFEGDGFASMKLMWIIPRTKTMKVISSSYLRLEK